MDNAPLFCYPRQTNSETANSPTLVLYAQSALTKPTRIYATYPAARTGPPWSLASWMGTG